MKVLAVVVLFGVVSCSLGRLHHKKTQPALDSEWENWKLKYEKEYASAASESQHRLIWEQSVKLVREHNLRYEEGESSFMLKLNQFSDTKQASYEQQTAHPLLKGHRNSRKHASNKTCRQPTISNKNVKIPASIDWREEGYVTEVKNQLPQQCLHSIYFAVTGALEGQWYKQTGKLLTLSEQNIADCCGAGSEQCNDQTGEPCSLDKVYQWIKSKGLETLENYPDTRADQQCAFDTKKKVATCSGYDFISKTEDDLKFAVATIGPISVMIDSSQPSFQAYSGGVYNEPKCSNTVADRNLLIVGYGTDSTEGDFWIAKNSWGPDWGEKGYIRLSRNRDNQCGVANTASYPFFSC